ncbi:DNA-directed RNA polymerase subunit alpha [Gossypium arboreum]|uniref:DNA-directed RNA polymerase subunit alpha n=1 Tax=Gossypium arboreum TaxID=29729 RepID=A0A0B0Q1E2_GOSAR|nr:DNA-directed RNA polymerase subunit alpha [Gossypium arboreum]
MGKQHGLDFITQACHTAVSIWQDRSMTYMGGSHARAHLPALTTSMSHGRVPSEPKFSPIRKKTNFEGF